VVALALSSTSLAGWNGSYWVNQTGTNRYVKTNGTSLVALSQSSAMTPVWNGLSNNPRSGTGSGAAMDLLTWYGRTPSELASLPADMKEDAWRDSINVASECDPRSTQYPMLAAVLTGGVSTAICLGVFADFIRDTGKKGVLPIFMKEALTKWTPSGYVLREKTGGSVLDIVQQVADGNPVLVTLGNGNQWGYYWTVVTGVSGAPSALTLTLAQGATRDAYGADSDFAKAFRLEKLTKTDTAAKLAGPAFGLEANHMYWFEKSGAGKTWGQRRTESASGSFDASLSSCRAKLSANQVAQVEAIFQTGKGKYSCNYEHIVCKPATATISLTDTGIKVVGLPPNGSFTLYQGPIGGGQSSSASTKAADSRGQFAYTIPTYPMAFEISVNGTCTDPFEVRAMKPLLVSDGPKIRISRLPAGGQFELITNKGTPPVRKTYTYTASANGTYVYTNVVGGSTQCSASSPCKFQAKVLDKSSDWLTHNAGVPADSVAAPAPVQRR